MALDLVLTGRDDLLDLKARRLVYQCVEDYPGLHLREIARQCAIDPNHARYHLGYLEKHGLLSSRDEKGFTLFFPRRTGRVGQEDAVAAGDKAVLALLRQPVPLHAVLVLLERGECSHAELDEAIPVSRTTLHYHMGKLERAGVVASTKPGRTRQYRLADGDAVLTLLMQYRPPDSLVAGFLEAWEALGL